MRRLGGVSLRDRARQRRAAQAAGGKSARLHLVRQGPGDLDQRLSAPGPADPASSRRQGAVPAGQRLRAGKDGRLGRDGDLREGVRGPLSRRSAVMSLAARFRLRAPNFAGSGAAFARLCLLPLVIVVAAFFVLPMARLVRVGAGGPKGLAADAALLISPRYPATLINTVGLAGAADAGKL